QSRLPGNALSHTPPPDRAAIWQRQGGNLAKNARTCLRRTARRSLTTPDASTPCTGKTFLAKSTPIVVTSAMDGSCPLVVDNPTLAPQCREAAIRPIKPGHDDNLDHMFVSEH